MTKDLKKWLIVVPARLGSTRLSRKVLADLNGLPVVVRVAQNLRDLANLGAKIVVATDSQEILEQCTKNNILCEMTDLNHPSGTDRCYEVAKRHPRPFVLNVQGDEPFLSCDDLLGLIDLLETHAETDMATLVHKSSDAKDFKDPNIVKVVANLRNEALYFSRAGVPFPREGLDPQFYFLQHLGTYGFRMPALEKFCEFPPSRCEQIEKLEQLRALENGLKIGLVHASKKTIGIDTAEDLEKARELIRGK